MISIEQITEILEKHECVIQKIEPFYYEEDDSNSGICGYDIAFSIDGVDNANDCVCSIKDLEKTIEDTYYLIKIKEDDEAYGERQYYKYEY